MGDCLARGGCVVIRKSPSFGEVSGNQSLVRHCLEKSDRRPNSFGMGNWGDLHIDVNPLIKAKEIDTISPNKCVLWLAMLFPECGSTKGLTSAQ